jgi:hypothetical protein
MSGLRLKPLPIPSPPRASRTQQLWGAEDTPGYDEEDGEEGDQGGAPLIQLPVDPSLVQPEPGSGPPESGPPVIFPPSQEQRPEPPEPEDGPDGDGPGDNE